MIESKKFAHAKTVAFGMQINLPKDTAVFKALSVFYQIFANAS